MARPSLDTIPAELLLHVLTFLTPQEVAVLQSVSKQMRLVGRDARFWRDLCFEGSRRASMLKKKSQHLMWLTAAGGAAGSAPSRPATTRPGRQPRRVAIAAWDPVFDGEPVSWYDEYIQRHAPISVNWFELPRRTDVRLPDLADVLPVCGLALYRPGSLGPGAGVGMDIDGPANGNGEGAAKLRGAPPLLAVAPLSDGSVCLWDVNGTVARRGAIVQQSPPGLLFPSAQGCNGEGTPQAIELSLAESVSVDSQQHMAFFAVQDRLVEVDLATLSVVHVETFPRAITALSTTHPSVPLTVGTENGICLHDARERAASRSPFRSVDEIASSRLRTHVDTLFPPPGPLSILHVQQPGSEEDISHDIYAAGRISSILHYDRRNFSAVKDAIHSGASLSSLTSIPYPFPPVGEYGPLGSTRAVDTPSAAVSGRTIVACGEYKTKGSLELYPIDPGQSGAAMINRQTSSFAKIFSVAQHGKRIVLSDGAGHIRWFERDGFTEARQCRLGSDDFYDSTESRAERESRATSWFQPGDLARKLLPVQLGSSGDGTSDDDGLVSNDLMFWTGEKLGLIRFSPKLGSRYADFMEDAKTEEERVSAREGQDYRMKMRQLFKSARYFGRDSDSDD